MGILEKATFGGSCSCCVEAVVGELEGVLQVVSGYMGGSTTNPTYPEICSGTTGHAEVMQVIFDPELISYLDLLGVFWASHNSTTLNEQGDDRGTQYRSAVFYHDEHKKQIVEQSIRDDTARIWLDPIVAESTAATQFYPAKAYHQNDCVADSDNGYCPAVINPQSLKVSQRICPYT